MQFIPHAAYNPTDGRGSHKNLHCILNLIIHTHKPSGCSLAIHQRKTIHASMT